MAAQRPRFPQGSALHDTIEESEMPELKRDFYKGVDEAVRVRGVVESIYSQRHSMERVVRSLVAKMGDCQLFSLTRLINRILATRELEFNATRADQNRQRGGN